MTIYRTEKPSDSFDIENLLDEAFGDDREAKTSYRYRDGVVPIRPLCLVAEQEGSLVGTIRYWPVLIAGQEALLLGPVAVSETLRGAGIGAALIRTSLGRAFREGWRLVVLAGDPTYYQRFGFDLAHKVGIFMPDEKIERFQYLALGATAQVPKGNVERAVKIAA
jgi:predicted N-acetyltransferase YhbS